MLFRFYNELDIKRVIEGMPWFFDRHLIMFHKMEKGQHPFTVPLVYAIFWVHINDLPTGSMSANMAAQLGNFISDFLEYDTIIALMGVKKYMRVKVLIDVLKPLKWKKRIIYGKEKTTYANFQYEKLSLFCFLYGRLRHGESFYPIRLSRGQQIGGLEWDVSLRAKPRRSLNKYSRWLWEEPTSMVKNSSTINGHNERERTTAGRTGLEIGWRGKEKVDEGYLERICR